MESAIRKRNRLHSAQRRRHLIAPGVLACFLCGGVATGVSAPAQPAIPLLASANFGWSKVADDFQAPLSGPGPVTFEKGHPYVPNNDQGVQVTVRIADLTNPICTPIRGSNSTPIDSHKPHQGRFQAEWLPNHPAPTRPMPDLSALLPASFYTTKTLKTLLRRYQIVEF